MLEGRIRPTTKPDISNALKGVEDDGQEVKK